MMNYIQTCSNVLRHAHAGQRVQRLAVDMHRGRTRRRCRGHVARAVQRRSLPKVLSAVRDGTLAMARVCWADSDEDLQRALHDRLAGHAERRAHGEGGPNNRTHTHT